MGGGSWTSTAYVTHSTTARGYTSMDAFMAADTQSLYKARGLNEALNPKNVVRECRDSEEHPNSLPVILALDVTGSMGSAATEIAKKLDVIMQDIFKKDLGRDVEFCVIAVGDQVCDSAPYQVSQFESDIRIAEALEKIYFEGCGGGNSYESYTGAWLWANDRTRCDCWSRGGKGVIITMGDELPTGSLSREHAKDFLGSLPDDDLLNGQKKDLEPQDILAQTSKKWNVFHISVDDPNTSYQRYRRSYDIDEQWQGVLGDHYLVSTLKDLAGNIAGIISKCVQDEVGVYSQEAIPSASPTSSEVISEAPFTGMKLNENGEVVW